MKEFKRIPLLIAALMFLIINGCADSDNKLSSENSSNNSDNIKTDDINLLEKDGEIQYFWKFEEDDCVLYCIDIYDSTAKRLAVFEPVRDDNDIRRNYIVDFGICDGWIILSVGHYAGTGNYFYGDFVRLKKDDGKLEHFWITDNDEFIIIDD